MKQGNRILAANPEAIARELGLNVQHAEEWRFQYSLLERLRTLVAREGCTHAELARRAGSSRTRVTSILNGNLDSVSSDLLIRLVSALGYRVKASVTRIKPAA